MFGKGPDEIRRATLAGLLGAEFGEAYAPTGSVPVTPTCGPII
jgi:hypothetical protein